MMQAILGRLLGAFGRLTLALYLALSLFGTVPWAHWVGATGALAFTSWIYLDWDSLSRFFGSQGGREQTISWTLVVVVAGIAGLALHFAQYFARLSKLRGDGSIMGS